MDNQQYYKYIDIAKGIAIILIVMGHIQAKFNLYFLWQRFFMLFHVAVFFMISGLTLNGEKAKNTRTFIWNKMKRIYFKALLFSVPAVLLHNFFVRIGFYYPELYQGDPKYDLYTKKEMVKQIALTFGCAGREPILSALWFVFVLLFALIGYSVLSGILNKFIKDKKTYESVRTILIWTGLVISAFLTNHYQFTINRFSNVFAAIALIHMAYLMKQYLHIGFDNWAVLIISLIGLIQNMEYGSIRMNENYYGNPIFLLSSAFFGLYLICFIAKKAESFKCFNILAYCGQKSFYIMALHIAAFKFTTLILQKIYPCNIEIGRVMPYVETLWELIIYIVAGIMIPLVIEKAIRETKERICNVALKC